jgi:hypothetical protein
MSYARLISGRQLQWSSAVAADRNVHSECPREPSGQRAESSAVSVTTW